MLVDNASADGTARAVRKHHPWVKVLASTRNLGFAAGNNLAAEHASGRYLLLLNPDAIPEPGALARGIALMDYKGREYVNPSHQMLTSQASAMAQMAVKLRL